MNGISSITLLSGSPLVNVKIKIHQAKGETKKIASKLRIPNLYNLILIIVHQSYIITFPCIFIRSSWMLDINRCLRNLKNQIIEMELQVFTILK